MGRREISDINTWPSNPLSNEGKLWNLGDKQLNIFIPEYDARLKNLADRIIFLMPEEWRLKQIDAENPLFVAEQDNKSAEMMITVNQSPSFPVGARLLQKMGAWSMDSMFSVWDNEWLLLQFTGGSFAIKTGTTEEIVRAGISEAMLQSFHEAAISLG